MQTRISKDAKARIEELKQEHNLSNAEIIDYLFELALPTFDSGTAKAERQLKEWLHLENLVDEYDNKLKITPSRLRAYSGANLNYCKKVLAHEDFAQRVEEYNKDLVK